MPAKRPDNNGAEGVATRVLGACRCSPLTCALIVCVAILLAATLVLWFAAGTVTNSPDNKDNCTQIFRSNGIYVSNSDYLGFAGILVIILIFAIVVAILVGVGLTVDSLPQAAKIVAAACSFFPVCALLLFLLWLGLGTAMAVFCPENFYVLFYLGLMWIYFLIVVAVGIVASLLIARSAKRAVQQALQ